MPNHIETRLTVTGDKKYLKAFFENHFKEVKEVDDEYEGKKFDFDFQTITPMPEELIDTVSPSPKSVKDAKEGHLYDVKDKDKDKESIIEKRVNQVKFKNEYLKRFGADNWYDWKLNNWGTKWGAYGTNVEVLDDQVLVDYNTAWSPATPILQKLGEMYPELTFDQTVLDEGMFFGGRQVVTGKDYSEEMYEGDDLYEFCNAEYGYNYSKCQECGEWYDESWLKLDAVEGKCENCQPEVPEVEEN